MMKYHVALPDGTREGPFDNEIIRAKISQGYYKRGCLVWHKEMKEWEPIEKYFPLNDSSAGKKSGLWVKLLGLLGLLACGIGGYIYYYDVTHISIEEAKERLISRNISADEYEKELRFASDYSHEYETMECILLVGNVSKEAKGEALKNSMNKGWLKNCEVLLKYHADLSDALNHAFSEEFRNYDVTQFMKEYVKAHADKPYVIGEALGALLVNNQISFFKELIEEDGADINAKNSEGMTPLMLAACFKGDAQLVTYLIQKGANLEAKDTQMGWTALTRACCIYGLSGNQERGEIVQLLLQNKANANAVDYAGYNCLMNLLRANYEGTRSPEEICPMVKSLIDAGADVNATTKKGVHLLTIAETVGNVPVMQLLAEHGAVNTTGKPYGYEKIFKD